MKKAVDSFWTYVFLNIVALIFSLWWFCFRNSYANYVILISVSFQYLISRYREDKEAVRRREKWDKKWRNIGSHGQPRALACTMPLCKLVRSGFGTMAVFPIDTATTGQLNDEYEFYRLVTCRWKTTGDEMKAYFSQTDRAGFLKTLFLTKSLLCSFQLNIVCFYKNWILTAQARKPIPF